jgi:hypothetical protein
MLKNFLEECKEAPLMSRIQFNSTFSLDDMEELKTVFIKPNIFPNLKCLGFTDLAFNFAAKIDLI